MNLPKLRVSKNSFVYKPKHLIKSSTFPILQIPRYLFIACALDSGLSACGSKDKTAEQATQTTITTTPDEATPAPATSPTVPTATAEPAAWNW